MAGYIEIPIKSPAERQQWGDLLMSLAAKATERIKQYMVTFIVEDTSRPDANPPEEKPLGSGTLVEMHGIAGILTAYHVAEELLKFPSFGLCIGAYRHSLDIFDTSIMQHIVVGKLPKDTPKEFGPDMSFLRITDESLLQKLRELKSFYPLQLPSKCLVNQIWGVSGIYHDSSRYDPNCEGPDRLLRVGHFLGVAFMPHETFRAGVFDFIRLTVPAGDSSGFPYRYDGMSGGGFWLFPMEMGVEGDASTVRALNPVLMGVEFSQLDRCLETKERVLVGHGPDSIYSELNRVLNELCQQTGGL